METENKELEKKKMISRKDRIKTIAIIFLVFMLILTFFSNTIMNWSLVQVSTEAVVSDVLTNKVRGTGTVEAGQVYDVSIKESRRIQTMYVKTDQMVSTGDILFTLAKTDSDELKAAKEELATAKTGYETNVLAAGITVDERLDIENGKAGSLSERQMKLVAAKNAAESAENNLNYIQNLVNEATAGEDTPGTGEGSDMTLDDLQDQLEVKVIENTLAEMQEDYDKAAEKQKTAQETVDSYQKQVDEAEESIADANKQLEKQKAKVATAKSDYEKAKSTTAVTKIYYDNAEKNYNAARDAFEEYKGNNSSSTYQNDSKYKELSDKFSVAMSEYSYYSVRIEEAEADEAAKKSTYNDILAAIDEANATIEKQQEVLDKANGKLTTAAADLLKANEDYKKLNKTYSKLTDKKNDITYNADIRKLQAQIDALKKGDGGKAEYLRGLQLKLTQATTYKAEKDKDLADMQDFLAKQISLATEFKNIKKLKKKVKELKTKSSEYEIKAPVSGIITAINLTAGQTITPDESIIQIQPENEDFVVSIDINAAQAKRINPQDEVTILNNWSANSITARVDSIRPSKTDKTMNTVRIKLLGDVKVGDSYTFSIGTSSNSYDYIVPTSAIKEDNNGKFVLTITSKSTPLGNRYYATRTDVEVLASDDTKSAVSGQFDENPYVITTTTKPVEAGQQVRLAE